AGPFDRCSTPCELCSGPARRRRGSGRDSTTGVKRDVEILGSNDSRNRCALGWYPTFVGTPFGVVGFRMTRRISVTGTLTKVDWINPHVVIAIEGKADDGKFQQWTFESNPPSWYRSVGLARADFARVIGRTVTVEGVRAKNDSAYGYMQK